MSDPVHQPKPLLPGEVESTLRRLHSQGKKIVFASGVFDVFHQEHLRFLENAKATGDVLVVAIESDVRVRQIKGEGRPIHSQEKRKAHLESLGIIDLVFILPEHFSQPAQHRQLIAEVRPDIFAVSSHTSHLDKKRAIVESFGGTLQVVHDHNPEVSTTLLLAQQQKP